MKDKIRVVDYIFWATLIVFSNPGGVQEALGIYKLRNGLNMNDLLFVILGICFISASLRNRNHESYKSKIGIALLSFMIYYFFVFGFLTPEINGTNVNHIYSFIKLRFAFYSFAIFYFSYEFWLRSWPVFVRFFIYSSTLILFLFLQSFFSGLKFLPTSEISRGFISIDRNMLLNYAFMPFLSFTGIITIIFNLKVKYRQLLIIGFLMVNASWILSLTRRHIIGFFIIIVLALIVFVYINRVPIGKNLLLVLRVFISIAGLVLLIIVFAPKYIPATQEAIVNSYEILKYGESNSGQVDERMSLFGRGIIFSEFKNNPFFGTGFNNLWRTREGDQLGYEASDYPFQSAFAMAGIIGILMFLPVYVILIRSIFKDIIFFRKANIRFDNLHNLFLLSFILYFVYNLIQYMNWFAPVSNAGSSYVFFSLLGLYFASRRLFYISIKQKGN